jgi:hypothetical protein
VAGEDPAYKQFVEGLHCCAPCAGGCVSRSRAHHHTQRRGIGTRAHDRDAMPLCLVHHDDFHRGIGPFRDWSLQKRRDWQDEMVLETQRAWERASEGRQAMHFE